MTLIDYTWDTPEADPSVTLEDTRWGYRMSEVEQKGWRFQTARIVFAALTFGVMAAGGMVWTLSDATFPGEPSIARAILSSALYIIAAALVANGAFSPRRDVVEVDVKGRVLNIVARSGQGWRSARKTIRFEEITRIELAETSFLSELKSALTQWDYGRISLQVHGKRPLHLVGGEMAELEPLLRRLRADTGVA